VIDHRDVVFLYFILFIGGRHFIGAKIVYHWYMRDINIFHISKNDVRKN
jgi:hypothetical protein